MKMAGIALATSGFVVATPAMAICADWDITADNIVLEQNNSNTVRLLLSRTGTQLRGEAVVIRLIREKGFLNQIQERKGQVDGSIKGDVLRLKIRWSFDSTGIYSLEIDEHGRLSGDSYDFMNPNRRAQVLGNQPLTCLAETSSEQELMAAPAGGSYAPPTPSYREDPTMRIAPERSIGRQRVIQPETCRSGLVWREARPEDRVCVTVESRSRVAQENAGAPALWDPGAGYGPHGCKSGFVWRAAFPGDDVCVSTDIRTLVARENQMAASNRVQ